MESQSLQREYNETRRREEEREKNIKSHEMISMQERISNQWKRELEKTSEAYERLLEKIKTENVNYKAENDFWKHQIQKAKVQRAQRIKVVKKSLQQEEEEKHHEEYEHKIESEFKEQEVK